MDGNIETGRLQTPKIEEANDDGKLTIYCQSLHIVRLLLKFIQSKNANCWIWRRKLHRMKLQIIRPVWMKSLLRKIKILY